MKKIYLLALACAATLSLFAEPNLALKSEGASATASSGKAEEAIDGNDGSRWESKAEDPQWWVLNFGKEQTFNTIQIVWEAAFTKTFSLEISSDSATWKTFYTVENQKLSDFPDKKTQTIGLDSVKGQFIRMTCQARGTNYGNSFFEFRVFNYGPTPLSKLVLGTSSNICTMQETITLSPAGVDGHDRAVAVTPNYTINPADAGSIQDNIYTPAKTGVAEIIAEYDGKADTVAVVCYGGANLALNQFKEESGHEGNDNAAKAVDGNEGSQWISHASTGGSDEDRTYDAWFTLDLGAFYSIDLITIKYEGACAQDYHIDFSTDYENWETGYTYVGKKGIDARYDIIHAPALSHTEEVRYIRYYMTKAATEYGMKIYEFQVFGSLIPDTEKPVLLGVELADSSYNSLTYRLSYTDNLFVARCQAEDKASMISGKYTVAEDSTVTITGLVQNHTYNFSFRVIDGSGNFSDTAIVATGHTTKRFTLPQTAPAKPEVPAEQVIAIYSDAYIVSPVWDNYKADWGDATQLKDIKVEGDNMLLYTNLNWLGWTCTSAIDASIMEKLHLDIWSERNGILEITPIYGGEGLETDDRQTYKAQLNAQRWNTIDIDLKKDMPALKLSSIFQFKYGNPGGLGAIAIDNVYFYRTTPYVDTVAPTNLTVKAEAISYNSANLVISAEDDGPSITYTILDGTKTLGTVSAASGKEVTYAIAGLKMGEKYSYRVFATDFAKLVSDTVEVEFSTLPVPAPGAAPTPIQEAKYVSSIYSNHFKPAAGFNIGNWYQKTQSSFIEIAEKDTAILMTEFDYVGWEINNSRPQDMTRHSYLHIDLYAPTASVISILPISTGLPDNTKGVALELAAEEWNSFNILLDEFATDFKKFIQIKFSDATGKVFIIDNVYFWGYNEVSKPEQGVENVNVNANVNKVLRNGQLLIEKNGVLYTVTGSVIR